MATPSTTEFPLALDAGERFVEPALDEDPEAELAAGRLAVVVIPGREAAKTLLVVELGDWSVACPLTSGQLHRLTNAVGGRGTRSGVRPESVDGVNVHLNGSPEVLIVETGDRVVRIPAGPKRALWKALRGLETKPPLSASA